MRPKHVVSSLLLLTLCLLPLTAVAQKAKASAGVPAQVRFSGSLSDASGAPRNGTVGILFAIYSERTGGTPLWQETQNVQLDGQGRYAILLGAGRALPKDIFTSTEARWLGVQALADAEPEQARVLLVSVPYALKAQDAETLGGRPASAYVLNEALGTVSTGSKIKSTGGQAAGVDIEGNVSTTVAHTNNAIPKFSAPDTLADSMMLELYNQAAVDAFGFALPNEDVLRLGNGTGLPKSLHVDGRVVSKGFDMVTSAANSLHIVNTNANGVALQANTEGTGFATALFGSARSFNGAGLTAFSFGPIGGGTPDPADYSVAVYSGVFNAQGVAVHAWSAYDGTPGGDAFPILTGPIGLYAAAAHSTGIAAVLDHRAAGGGKLLSGRNGGTEVITMTTAGNITATGTVTATSFSGSGAGLTGITGGNLSSNPAPCGANNFVTDIAADGTLTCAQPSSSNLSDVASLATKAYADAGDASLAAPQYVTLAASSTLTSERVLTAGKGIAITDGTTTVTIDNKVDFAQTSVQAGDTLSSIGSTGAVFATDYVIPANTITAGSVIEVWASGAQISDASGMSFGYGIDIGSTAVLTSSPLAGIFMNANTTGTWTLQARVICTGVTAGTATFEASGVNVNTSSASSWGSRNFSTAGATVDATSAQTLRIRELVNTNGADTATMRQLIVKILK